MEEILGVCEYCGQDVVYYPGMDSDDPTYPAWGYARAEDQDDGQDFVYHWGCSSGAGGQKHLNA